MVLSSNKRLAFLASLLTLVCIVLSCQSAIEKESSDSDESIRKRPEMSELALLMRRMDKMVSEWKKDIEMGTLDMTKVPDWLDRLHTAEATDPEEINEVYHTMADAWIESVVQLKKATQSDIPKAFNALVNNCVNCHQQFCQGPIPKIKKLYVDIPQHVSGSGN